MFEVVLNYVFKVVVCLMLLWLYRLVRFWMMINLIMFKVVGWVKKLINSIRGKMNLVKVLDIMIV